MDPVVVVGAGLAGVAAAGEVAAAGLDVVVLDRGHKVGGRMASPTTEGRVVDTGASYFTVSDPAFQAVVDRWRERGLAREWTDTFHMTGSGGLEERPGPMRWAARRGLRSLVEDLAADLDVRRQTVAAVQPGPRVDGAAAAAVVLAMPDPQARRLLESPSAEREPAYGAELAALTDPYQPVLALTARWPGRAWPDLDGVFVNDHPVLTWLADDGRRRGDGAPVLVAHSTAAFAGEHLAAAQEAAAPMVVAVRDLLGVEVEPASASVHRWTFGKPARTREQPYFLGETGVGLCGDAWSTKPRVEAAYLSGVALGRAVADRLG